MSSFDYQSDYEAYIAQKHTEMQTPPDMLSEFVKRATGQAADTQKRLMFGETNEVYDVKTKGGQEVIIRVSHEEDETFEKEQWAIEQCQTVGVPVPNVLLVEDVTTDGKFRSICVLEKLRGEPLMKRVREKTISPEEVEAVLKETGRLLARVHGIEAKKFGKIDETGTGSVDSWEDYILRRTSPESEARVQAVARKIEIDPKNITKATDILRQHTDVYAKTEPRLLHGDLGHEHIFIDGINITGIIDWGNALSGDPIHDFAWWNFFHKDDETGLLLMEGYDNKQLFKGGFGARLNLCRLYLSLDFLHYYDLGNFRTGLEIARANLVKGLNYFG